MLHLSLDKGIAITQTDPSSPDFLHTLIILHIAILRILIHEKVFTVQESLHAESATLLILHNTRVHLFVAFHL